MYFQYIDGLRAFAVMSVLIYHLNPEWLHGGFSGVDVFYIVSGFVVSFSLDKHKQYGFLSFLSYFYYRRIKRILPALVFCLMITVILAAMFIPDSYLSSGFLGTAFFSYFGLSNIKLAVANDSYFGPLAEYNPFTHTWSLGVEEQFYFLFPFIFYLWIKRDIIFYKKASVILLSMLFILSVCVCAWEMEHDKLKAYYMIYSRFWQLASGILMYMFISGRPETPVIKNYYINQLIAIASLCLVLIGFVYADGNAFPLPWSIPSVVGVLGLLLSLHNTDRGPVYKLMTWRPISIIGKLSYSLYLWHWPITVLFKWTVGLDNLLNISSATVIMFLMSYISYIMVETKFRFSPLIIKMQPKVVIVSGILVMFLCASLTYVIFKNQTLISLSVTADKSQWYANSNYVPSNNDLFQSVTTELDYMSGKMIRNKIAESGTDKNAVYVLGDSHAYMYFQAAKKYSAITGRDTVIFTKTGCWDIINKPLSTASGDCVEFIESALNIIESEARKGDVVMFASLKLPRLAEQWELDSTNGVSEKITSEKAVSARSAAFRENNAIFKRLTDKSLIVVLEAPKPILGAPPYRCSDWFNKDNPICENGVDVSRDFLQALRQPVMQSMNSYLEINDNIYIYDAFDLLCEGTICRAFDKAGMPLFFDADHISGYASVKIGSDLAKKIENMK